MSSGIGAVLGRWNGDSRRIVYTDTGMVMFPSVCYLKISEEQKGALIYRIIYTEPDAQTHKLSLEFNPDSGHPESYHGHAPHDEYYAQGVLKLKADPTCPGMFVITLTQKEGGLRVVTHIRLSKDGTQLALTSTSYDDQGVLVSTETASLRPCDPSKPPSFPIVDALGGWEVEPDVPSSVTATEVTDE